MSFSKEHGVHSMSQGFLAILGCSPMNGSLTDSLTYISSQEIELKCRIISRLSKRVPLHSTLCIVSVHPILTLMPSFGIGVIVFEKRYILLNAPLLPHCIVDTTGLSYFGYVLLPNGCRNASNAVFGDGFGQFVECDFFDAIGSSVALFYCFPCSLLDLFPPGLSIRM